MSQDTEIPQYFHEAVRSMTEAEVRSGIQITEIRPPRNLAPLSHAVGLEVLHTDENSGETTIAADSSGHDAFGRLILLHDPPRKNTGATQFLISIYPRCEWWRTSKRIWTLQWHLTRYCPTWHGIGSPNNSIPDCTYTDLGGTVTSTASVRYGEIGTRRALSNWR